MILPVASPEQQKAVPVPQLLAGSVRRHCYETLMFSLLSLNAHGERDLLLPTPEQFLAFMGKCDLVHSIY